MRRIQNLVITIACCLYASGLLADTTEFRVDSYIPDRFADLQWRVDGGFSLGGYSRKSSDALAPAPSSNYQHTAYNSQDVNLGSLVNYRFFSVPRFLNLYGSAQTFIRWNSYSSSSESYQAGSPYARYYKSTGDDDDRNDQYSIRLTGSAGEYLVGDWYLAHGVDFDFTYSGGDAGRSTNEQLRIDTIGSSVHYDYRHTVARLPSLSRRRWFRISTGIGFGRVYEGQFAVQALEIESQLARAGLLNRSLSADELRGLAATIYRFRQELPVDVRILRIEAIQEICAYLARHGEPDPAFLAAAPYVQDVWDYFDRDARLFGWQIEFLSGFEYRDQTYDRTTEADIRTFRTDSDLGTPGVIDTLADDLYRRHRQDYDREQRREVFIQLVGRYHRPLSLRWQFDCEANVRFSLLTAIDQTSRDVDFESGLISVRHSEDRTSSWREWHIFPAIKYVFDKRTSLSADAELSYQDHSRLIAVDRTTRYNRGGLYASIGLNGVYRISLPTTLQVRLSADRWELDPHGGEYNRDWNYSIRGSASHYLF